MNTAAAPLRIDFVSDIACPWCAVGLWSLEAALAGFAGRIAPEWHFQPFELEPDMPPEGADAATRLMAKYGMDRAQLEANRAAIVARGATLGFRFDYRPDTRSWNTFDAHRLLHWAGLVDGSHQLALKKALLRANFSDGENVSEPAVLTRLAGEAGLDATEATSVLADGRYGAEVREAEAFFSGRGIRSVPSIIFNQRHLISGGQPPETFAAFLHDFLEGRLEPREADRG